MPGTCRGISYKVIMFMMRSGERCNRVWVAERGEARSVLHSRTITFGFVCPGEDWGFILKRSLSPNAMLQGRSGLEVDV